MPSRMTIGAKVRDRRDDKQMTRRELARIAGTSVSTITRLELYGHVPNPRALRRIAQVLDLSVDELLLTA